MCAVVVVLLVAIAVAARPGRHAGHTDTHSATPPTTAAGGASTAPAGWVGYRDPATGFTIAYPSGWTVSRNGSFTDFRDPASARSLRVDWTATPGPSAEAAWRSLAASFGPAHAGYAEIGIAPTTYKGMPAATWEFAYDQGGTRFHNVDLGMVTGRYGFALDFQTADGDWAASQPVFQAFRGTFAAAR